MLFIGPVCIVSKSIWNKYADIWKYMQICAYLQKVLSLLLDLIKNGGYVVR